MLPTVRWSHLDIEVAGTEYGHSGSADEIGKSYTVLVQYSSQSQVPLLRLLGNTSMPAKETRVQLWHFSMADLLRGRAES